MSRRALVDIPPTVEQLARVWLALDAFFEVHEPPSWSLDQELSWLAEHAPAEDVT